VRGREAEAEVAVAAGLFVLAAATPEDEAGWAAVLLLFFEVDAAAGAVEVEAAPILGGGIDDEVESELVKGRFSSDVVVVVVVPSAAASLAAAASWWRLPFSREFISAFVVVESVPPVVLSTSVVPSLAGAAASVGKLELPAAAGGVVDSVPDALVRREAVEGL
jgi:hypothetical protein